jgi:site-specific recombinase XerD
MKAAQQQFPALLQRFFTQRLMQQKRVSGHTISSYRDSFRLLLRFAHKRLRTAPDRLTFDQIDAPLISAFLNEQEKSRGISPSTRNLRLTAIRSFFRFAAYEVPENASQIQRVLATPTKRFDRRLIHYLTRPEVEALIDAPDKRTWNGRRDHALMVLAVQTGLRLSEVTSLTRENFTWGTGAHVTILGKGRKQRAIPLCKTVVVILKAWLAEPAIDGNADFVFPSMRGGRLSADAVQHLMGKHILAACKVCPSLRNKRITFHCLRHTMAMDLLRAGFEQSVIALWLGHESPSTTQIYLDADLDMKEKILAKMTPIDSKPGKFRPDNQLLSFLNQL